MQRNTTSYGGSVLAGVALPVGMTRALTRGTQAAYLQRRARRAYRGK